jgi:uncharacterized protein
MVPGMQRFSPGSRIVLRELWGGRIWTAFPAIVVEDREDRFVNHLPAGVTIHEPVDDQGSVLRIPQRHWTLRPAGTSSHRVLAFGFPPERYAVLLLWEGNEGPFAGYYVNIETWLRRTPISYDYVDHLLDALVSADRSQWSWKDEDELAEAVSRGVYSDEDARAFRSAGERGVRRILDREPPFDRDWSGWRPDPAWPTPELLDGWDRA